MIRATAIVRRPAVRDEKVADAVTLDHRARQGRDFAFTSEGGRAIELELEKAVALDDGDAVKLEDGRLVRVRAAAEALMEVTSPNPARLLKAAWQLGQRQLPTEITEAALYVPADGALMETLRGLGVSATPVTRPFRPDKGTLEAVGTGHHHGHEHHGHEHHGHEHHGHDHHGHEHHGHEHQEHQHQEHGHDHGAAAPGGAAPGISEEAGHRHGPGCGHDHDHAAHHHGHDHGDACTHTHPDHEHHGHEHHGHEHHDHEHHGHGHHGHTHVEAQPAQGEGAGVHQHGPGCGHDHRHG